jgi:hypothetical protein
LINSAPKIVLLVVDFDEDFVEVKGITITSEFLFRSAGVNSTEFDAPEADRFAADSDASLSKEIFDIAVAQIEAIVEPDGVGNDIGWESMVMRWTPLVEPASSRQSRCESSTVNQEVSDMNVSLIAIGLRRQSPGKGSL